MLTFYIHQYTTDLKYIFIQVDRTPIHLAAQNGHIDIVDLLIAGGASVNHTDMVLQLYFTFLCFVLNDHDNFVKCESHDFILHHYQLNMTPLHWACDSGHVDIVRLLLRNGAKMDVESKVIVHFYCQ